MARTCPHCGCSDIDEDAGRGDATCMRCGTVLEESIVVAENQFQERAGGSGHTLVGQFVSLERGQAQARAASHGLVSQESREVTFARGRKLIEEIASQLRINQHCIDTSYNFFKMSVSRNLTRGRVRSHVVAACLYMTCRLENTAHLLLDFSDVTQVNMFDLGRTLNFLSRSLRINLPSTDPCLYIMRFACLMELGEKLKEVVNLATRLVQRMKRDWMSMGRRPTGLCGAALLLAARAFNFNRTISDVVKVVHISEPKTPDFSQFAPTLHSLGISPLKAAPTPNLDNSAGTYTPLPSQDRPDGSLDLSGIDDDEIDTYILTAKESEVKERFWMRLNGEHLKEMERRRKEREEEEEKEKGMPSKKKRRRTNAPRQNLASSTAIEAMEKIIHEKRLSNKVNYEILKEIEQTATGTDHLEREPAQVIENVNDLVATLAMDKITKSENLLGNTNPFPLTPENMSRRERELARKNKPLKDATALRVAFKMEPSPLLGGVSEVKEAEPSRPIALSRCSRHGRGSRPNLSRFGVRNSAPNTGTSSSVLAKTKPVPLNHPEPAKRETGLLTRSRRVCAKPRVVVVKDRSVEEGASRDLPPKQVIALNKEPKSSIENSLIIQESSAAVEEVTGSSQEATVANELSETGEKAPKLLRRGRRPLIKPVLPKTQAAIKEIGKTSQINDGNVGVPDEKPTVVINSSVTSEESKSAAALTKELDIISPPRKRPCLRSPERHHSPKLLRSRPRMSAKVPRGSGKQ
ncbi:hypothetical protein GCK32_004904 [Trichostrongylus colubriformis]|uniref:B-related factor 1 n=1 Tax=Trichostrongylus colubriformis TaxID=6319 RepID=A0AAN8F9F8_TRICO